MKKLVLNTVLAYIVVMLLSCMTSCSSHDEITENIYPVRIERSLDIVYQTACDYLSLKYDYKATDEKKISVIRCADLADEGGDVFPEMDEYGDIASLVWPRGYGK